MQVKYIVPKKYVDCLESILVSDTYEQYIMNVELRGGNKALAHRMLKSSIVNKWIRTTEKYDNDIKILKDGVKKGYITNSFILNVIKDLREKSIW